MYKVRSAAFNTLRGSETAHLAIQYLFLWVYETPPSTETGGQFYPKAIGHIFVGLYIEQICLAGLFFLARDSEGKPSAIPAGAPHHLFLDSYHLLT